MVARPSAVSASCLFLSLLLPRAGAVLPISGPVDIVKLRHEDGGVLLPGSRDFARGAPAE